MSRNIRLLRCTDAEVFEILRHGWLYSGWVVGASRMRQVPADWPAVGSRIHHSFGVWPLLLDDATVVEEYDPPRRLVLRARGWPAGEARVRIDVFARGTESTVRIQEDPVSGPARFVPRIIREPLLHWRNTETLHRLALLAEGRAARPPQG